MFLYRIGIIILIIFGSHAIIEYCSGGFKNDKHCKFYKLYNRYNLFDNDDISYFKTTK